MSWHIVSAHLANILALVPSGIDDPCHRCRLLCTPTTHPGRKQQQHYYLFIYLFNKCFSFIFSSISHITRICMFTPTHLRAHTHHSTLEYNTKKFKNLFTLAGRRHMNKDVEHRVRLTNVCVWYALTYLSDWLIVPGHHQVLFRRMPPTNLGQIISLT